MFRFRARSPIPLIPLAFLTLACGQPLPPVVAVPEQKAPATQKTDAPATGAPAKPADAAGGVRLGRVEPLPKKAGTMRLASYNVENLFDDKDDPSLSGTFEDKDMTTSPERLAALAATIKRLDADVLAMTEIESKEALMAFRDGYLKGLGYDHVASIDAGDPRGIEQAVLSRYPIVEATNWPQEDITDMQAKREGQGWATPSDGKWPKRWARSPLLVRVKAPDGYELTLFVVHFKASKGFDAQRELEGLQTLQFVNERLARNPNENLAILGDFNATPSAKSVKLFLDTESPRLRNSYDRRSQPNAPSETYLTHVTNRPIDFIFMSPGLFKDTIDKSFFVLGTPLPPKNADREAPKPAGYASDHMPIAIDLETDVKRRE
jgi:endonuclease/exonuclease/phosphatase family metal-dependent hydrolase